MSYWRLAPDPRLRSCIQCYALVSPLPKEQLRDGPLWEQQLLLPDGYSEIVFTLSGRFERRPLSGDAGATIMGASYVIGGRSHSVVTRNLSSVRVASVKLDSRLLRAILRMPLSELQDSTLGLDDLNCRQLLQIEHAVLSASSVAEIKDRLDTFFLQTMALEPLRAPAVDELLRQIHRTQGSLSILDFARDHRIDARTLERNFSASMGMMPKQYARIVRFKRSYYRLMLTDSHTHDLRAHLEGYYDQSHFHRDFKRFLGVAPRDKLQGKVPSATTVSDHLLQGEFETEVDGQ
ncbi:MAG: AraC family transcriptional regulator [Steroidobacter sp.]